MAPRCYGWDNQRMLGRVTKVPEPFRHPFLFENDPDVQRCEGAGCHHIRRISFIEAYVLS